MNNKENKNTEKDKNNQDKDKLSSNNLSLTSKIQSEIKGDFNMVINNYEMANLKSASKINKHTDLSK